MDSAPWAAAGAFMSIYGAWKMEVGSRWVNLGCDCDMALVDGRSLHFGEF